MVRAAWDYTQVATLIRNAGEVVPSLQVWANQVQIQLCTPHMQRICVGVMKYGQHCRLSSTGQDSCLRVLTAHKYPNAGGTGVIPLNNAEFPTLASLEPVMVADRRAEIFTKPAGI
ncbi:hypothetical protein B0H13DRAFT_2301506 [Mycena leptocephala]|nr:hypothetical protein B0H13DRAFT_2301506 [Mycena leptocephala]